MLINEVCRECNLTKKAIEYYGEHGLISPVIMDNGYRQFSEADVSKLKSIAVLRGLDFSVSDIRTVLENDGISAIYDVLNKKELEIADRQTKQALIKQLADSGDWEHIRTQIEALQKKQSILTRILDKFPGSYGKFVCLHFAPFLGELITTEEQQDAFETIIRFLDGIAVTIPGDLQEYLDETIKILILPLFKMHSVLLQQPWRIQSSISMTTRKCLNNTGRLWNRRNTKQPLHTAYKNV